MGQVASGSAISVRSYCGILMFSVARLHIILLRYFTSIQSGFCLFDYQNLILLHSIFHKLPTDLIFTPNLLWQFKIWYPLDAVILNLATCGYHGFFFKSRKTVTCKLDSWYSNTSGREIDWGWRSAFQQEAFQEDSKEIRRPQKDCQGNLHPPFDSENR